MNFVQRKLFSTIPILLVGLGVTPAIGQQTNPLPPLQVGPPPAPAATTPAVNTDQVPKVIPVTQNNPDSAGVSPRSSRAGRA